MRSESKSIFNTCLVGISILIFFFQVSLVLVSRIELGNTILEGI